MTNRRNFLQLLAAAGGMATMSAAAKSFAAADMIYDPPRFGNLSLLQIGDTHGQLLPAYLREPSVYIGVGDYANRAPFLVGEDYCEYYGIAPQTLRAHAHSHLHFEALSQQFGPTGGFAHIATVIRRLRASRPESLLLDCGDGWFGSGLALMTHGEPMIAATRELGVDAMTGDWEFALGIERIEEALRGPLEGRVAFLAQNLHFTNGQSKVLLPYSMYIVGGTPVAVVGQAYPRIGEVGRDFGGALSTGIDEVNLQYTIGLARARGARLVVLLSHAGLLADLKLATRVGGIDVILSGHSHDALPEPLIVRGRRGQTLVSSVGAHGKFVGVLDLDVRDGRIRQFRYRLIPIFSRLIPPDPSMQRLVAAARAPLREELESPIAVADDTLFRRDNFMGSFDQIVLAAVLSFSGAEIAMGPGHRWGCSVLPGATITFENILDPLAVPNAEVRLETLTGEQIRERLEAELDGVFNSDPYLQTGEDMVRVLGLAYEVNPAAERGYRVGRVTAGGATLDLSRRYLVASWGMTREGETTGVPVWRVVTDYLRRLGRVPVAELNKPSVVGAAGNLGIN